MKKVVFAGIAAISLIAGVPPCRRNSWQRRILHELLNDRAATRRLRTPDRTTSAGNHDRHPGDQLCARLADDGLPRSDDRRAEH